MTETTPPTIDRSQGDPSQSDATRSTSSKVLVIAVPVLMLAMVVLPYTLLSEVNAWYGSTLLWIAGTAVIIGINIALSRSWKD